MAASSVALRRLLLAPGNLSVDRSWLNSTTALCGVLAAALLAATMPHPAQAMPQGGSVVSGSATITQTGNQLKVVQTTPKVAINWQSYGIAANEIVTYYQPNAQAIALNRVLGGGASNIYGQLSANGQIWISNPSGIFFGPGSRVNVGGLIATTHDLTIDNFNAGIYHFESDSQPPGIIENQGNITIAEAGLAAFVAPGVVNHGVITARLGQVTLASGNEFTVDLYGDQKINLALDNKTAQQVFGRDGQPLDALVKNDGQIFADGGRVQLTAAAAKGIVDNVISVGGLIEARSVQQVNGEIILGGDGGNVQVTGTLDASGKAAGQTGGTVTVTGDTVKLKAGARIDVSGSAGGGQALIGGDFRGGNATAADYVEYNIVPARKPVPPADTTTVEAGVTVTADAITSGKGGELIFWSTDATSVHGSLSSRGGSQGGDGGFIETSAHWLDVSGISASTYAPQGLTGNWLLDPYSITIATSGATGTPFTHPTYNSSTTSTILDSDINNALSITGLTITTGGAAGDITLNDGVNITWSNSHTLILQATGNIIIGSSTGATINNTGAGQIRLKTDSSGTTGTGTLTINPGSVIEVGSGLSHSSGFLYIWADAISIPGAATITGHGVGTYTQFHITPAFAGEPINILGGSGGLQIGSAITGLFPYFGRVYISGGSSSIEIYSSLSVPSASISFSAGGSAFILDPSCTLSIAGNLNISSDSIQLGAGSSLVSTGSGVKWLTLGPWSGIALDILNQNTSGLPSLVITQSELNQSSGFNAYAFSNFSGDVRLNGNLSLTNSTLAFYAGSGSSFIQAPSGQIHAGGDVSFYADNISLLNDPSTITSNYSGANITFAPSEANTFTTVGVAGGVGTLQLSQNTLYNSSSGFASVSIGDSGYSGAIDVAGGFNLPLNTSLYGSNIIFEGAITGAGRDLSLEAYQNYNTMAPASITFNGQVGSPSGRLNHINTNIYSGQGSSINGNATVYANYTTSTNDGADSAFNFSNGVLDALSYSSIQSYYVNGWYNVGYLTMDSAGASLSGIFGSGVLISPSMFSYTGPYSANGVSLANGMNMDLPSVSPPVVIPSPSPSPAPTPTPSPVSTTDTSGSTTNNPNINNAVNQVNVISQAPAPSPIFIGGPGGASVDVQGPMPVIGSDLGGQQSPVAQTASSTQTTQVVANGSETTATPENGANTPSQSTAPAPLASAASSSPVALQAPIASGPALVMVASVPVLTTPVAPTLTQLSATPQVQQGVQTVSTALTTASSGGGSVHDTLVSLNTGSTKLTMQEQKAVFANVPTPKLVGGLLSSSNPVDKAVGGQLQQVSSGNVKMTLGDVKAVLAKSGVTGPTAQTYLAMYQVVHKEAMTTLFNGALQELKANPSVADIPVASTPTRGTRGFNGVTATESGAATKAAVPREAFTQIVLPKVSSGTDAAGSVVIRGRLDNWQPGMDVSQRSVGPGAIQVASLDGGSIEDLLGVSLPRQVAETTPTKIEGWTGGRQVRINGRWIFVHDDGSFEVVLPAGAEKGEVKLTIVDESGQVHEQTPTVQEAGSGTIKAPQPRKIAVLFANTAYSQNGIPDLNTPANDAVRVSEVLHNKLGFVTRVINNATKADMVQAIEALHSEATEGDQVFIYYAGHGYENERTGVGYWLPTDATTTSAKNWVSTRDMARLLRRVPAKNIMLVADSCYSGSFTKEQNFDAGNRAGNLDELGNLRGVMAMSSGGDEPVMDGEVNSPFARSMVDHLKEVSAATVGEQLFTKIKVDVTASTPQTPQYGVISSAGYDPGADYLIRENRAQVSAR